MALCKKCKCQIDWKITKSGKRTPVNPDGTPHWATCPDAASLRTQRAGAPGAGDWGDAS